jgi:hypothetical protein
LIPMRDPNALVEAVEKIASRGKNKKSEKPDDQRNVTEVLKIYEEVLESR